MAHELAIIVPAYKARYLAEALESIAGQSDQNFKLYVFDDASPDDVAGTCRRSLRDYPHSYHRFDSNLGGSNLPAHWDRCVEMTQEPWLWLFSDDDVMSIDCVRALRKTIELHDGSFDVYAFNVDMIDPDTRLLLQAPPLPEVETVVEFAINKMTGSRLSFMPDHAFSRRAYVRAAGFRPFPMAWSSDDAAWVEFGQPSGIRRVDHARVAFRSGEINISNINGAKARPKLDAALAYVRWLRSQLEGLLVSDDTAVRMQRAASRYVLGTVRWQGIPISLQEALRLVRPTAESLHCGRFNALCLTLLMVVTPRLWRWLQAVRKFANKRRPNEPPSPWNWKEYRIPPNPGEATTARS